MRPALAGLLLLALLVRVWRLDAVPPGVWFDEAANTRDALRVWGGEHFIFFEGNLGREPLYLYVLAPVFGLFGPGAVALRAVSVGFGMAMVASTYALGHQLFGARAALYATALAAFSYWHLHLSRTGFRAISLPAVQTAALAVVWLGFSRGAFWPFPVGGALLGLTAYTYSSSRFVTPGLLGLLVLGLVARRRWREAAALVLAAVAVAAPLALYFWRNPAVFADRATRIPFVNPLESGAALRTWLGSARDTAAMLLVSGDGLARHNLPSRPAFDAVAGALFLLGLALLVHFALSPERVGPSRGQPAKGGWDRAAAGAARMGGGPPAGAALFLLGWLLVASVPVTFTLENPHFLRSIGLLPAIYLVAGVGAAAIHGWSPRRAPVLVGLAVAFSASLTLRDYFLVWPTRVDTYERTMADVPVAARLLDELPAGPVYVSNLEYGGPQPMTALVGERPGMRGFDGRLAIVFPPPEAGRILYVLPRSATMPWARVDRFFPESTLLSRVAGPDGADGVRVHAVEARAFQPRPDRPLGARFGDAVELLGYDLPRQAPDGAELPVVLYWRVIKHAWYSWEWRFTLIGEKGEALSPTVGHDTLFANGWRVDEDAASWIDLPRPAASIGSVAYVALGILDRDKGQPVPIFDGAGGDAGNSIRLGPTRLDPPPAPAALPAGLTPLGTRFGEAMELVGYRLAAPEARPGATLEVTLAWRAHAPPPADYTAFLQLIDGAGVLRAQRDARPGTAPTSVWAPGEVVVETVRLALPPDAPPGPARLIAGLYELPSVRRLSLPDGRDHATLGSVLIRS